MKKTDFFLKDGVFVQNDKYILKALSQMKEKLKEEHEEFLIRNPDAEKIANERYIMQYRYIPK